MPRKRRTWTKKRKTKKDEKWYIIRHIVDERTDAKGEVEYLVDWEDDPETGEAYENSWTKSAWVTSTARSEWESHKARRSEIKEQKSPAFLATDQQITVPTQEATTAAPKSVTESVTEPVTEAPTESEDSQPPRPANQRHLQRVRSLNLHLEKRRADREESEEELPARKRPRDYDPSPSQEPAPSITSSASFPSATSYDILDEASPTTLGPSRLALTVELNQPDFDVSEYHSVQATQSSLYSSQPISVLEAQDTRVAFASNSSQKTIPDSQETSDPSSLESTTHSSDHRALHLIIVGSQSQLVSHRELGEDLDEATRNRGQTEDTLSSVPKEFIPESIGSNTDIPSRQPAHHLNLYTSLEDTETQGRAFQQSALKSQTQQLSLSGQLDLAEQKGPGVPLDPELRYSAPSLKADASQAPDRSCQGISGQSYSPGVLTSASEALVNYRQPQSAGISYELGLEVFEPEAASIRNPGYEEQQVFQPGESSLNLAVSRQISKKVKSQTTEQDSCSSDFRATATPGPVSSPSVTSKPVDQTVGTIVLGKDPAVVTGSSQVPLPACTSQDSAAPAQIANGEFVGDSQSVRADAQVEERILESSEPIKLCQSVRRASPDVEASQRAPSSERWGVSQASYLTQPDFFKVHSRCSSSHQARTNDSTPRPNRSSLDLKGPTSKKLLPEYSPGILLSLCEDSQEYSSVMLGSEGDEAPVSRSSALSGMQAIWDDEPAEMENKGGIGPIDLPLTEPMISSSNYHSVAIAGSPTREFLSQLPEQGTAWATSESSGLASQLAAPSAAVAGMRKLLNDDYLEMSNAQPATVSPADVSLPSEAERLTLPVLPSHDATGSSYSNSGQFISPNQILELEKEESSPLKSEAIDSYLVTLPFPSNLRQRYYSTITKYQAEAAAYVDLFTSEQLTEPEPSLSAAISNLFAVLRNLCDYPENIHDLRSVPVAQQVKYYMDSNAKLNFLYELFQAITQNIRILIVARSPDILRMICNIAESLHLEVICDAFPHSVSNQASHLRLTLSHYTATVDPWQHDVVITYDSVANDSDIMKQLASGSTKEHQLLVLRLAIAFTLEHIEAEIPPPDIPLMRKATVLNATVNARYLVLNPPRLPKPHEVAAMFSKYLNRTADTIAWDPEPLPAAVIDIYATQPATQTQRELSADSETAGRKRKPDAAMDADTKRLRVELQTDIPPLSDSLQYILREVGFTRVDAGTTPRERQLSMPLEVMEALAQKYLETKRAAAAAEELEPHYRLQANSLQRQVKDYEETQNVAYRRLREAIADRTQYEANAHKAEAALKQANEAANVDRDKARRKIDELEAVIARLTQDSALSANEKLLEAAHHKIQTLEKRLETSHGTEAYTRDLYQQVSNTVHATNSECERLRGRNAELEKKASENIAMAQREQTKSSAKAYLAKIAELETSLREAQVELDRTREENRNLRNGRRETRQVSVPCSPRVGSLMSPRPRAAFAGVASRAASPAPVMSAFDGGSASSQFSTPSGSSRFIRRP